MRNLFIAGVIASALLIAGCPKAVTPPPPPVVQHFVTMHWDDVRAPGYTIYRGASPDALAPLDVTANPQYADKHVAAFATQAAVWPASR